MNALAITEIGAKAKAELIRMERPRATDDSVVIRTAYSGVSAGTEMWIAEGRRHDYGPPPFVNGYQATGTVVEVGNRLQNEFQPGDFVAVFCAGAHAEYVRSAGNLVYKLERRGSLRTCSLFVQPSVAANAWNMANIQTGEVVYVVGQGIVGQCAAYLAKLRGAYVIASDVSPERLRVSGRYCADWALDASATPAAEAIAGRFPQGVDAVAESTGFQPLLNDALRSCKYQGKFVFLGWYPGDVNYNFQLAHSRELHAYYPVFIGPPAVQKGIIRLIESGALDMGALISHECGWEQSAEGYNGLFTERRNAINAMVIRWDDGAAEATTTEAGVAG